MKKILARTEIQTRESVHTSFMIWLLANFSVWTPIGGQSSGSAWNVCQQTWVKEIGTFPESFQVLNKLAPPSDWFESSRGLNCLISLVSGSDDPAKEEEEAVQGVQGKPEPVSKSTAEKASSLESKLNFQCLVAGGSFVWVTSLGYLEGTN